MFVMPIAAANLLVSLWKLIRNPSAETAWVAVLSLAALFAVFKIRMYALRVQDRVIRLEERLRFSALLPEALRSRVGELTERQLIALRFASDAEVPGLAEKALAANMPPTEIKKSVVNWRQIGRASCRERV